MSASAVSSRAVSLPLALRGRIDTAALGCWLAAFGLVAYLGLRGGGYDPLIRGEVGVALWWIVLVGAAAGVLPAARLRWPAWAGIGLLAAFGAWTLLSATWAESSERSVAEAGRVAAYAAVLVVGLAAQGRSAARHLVHGVAAAIVVVAGVAVVSRLQPQLFEPSAVERFFPFNANRLSYPLGYWNLLAALAAMAIPLLLGIAAQARSIAFQALAAGAIPILVLCAYLTVSRGAVGFVAVGLIAWLVLAPDRLAALATAALTAAASTLVIAAAVQREALQANLRDAAHLQQGDELLAYVVVVCLGVALVQVAIGLLARHAHRPRALVLPRRHAPAAFAAVALAAVVAFVAVGGPGAASDQWESFKGSATAATPAEATTPGADPFSRLQIGLSGNGRYGYWVEALQAQKSAPLLGIGPGAFEFWWSRNAEVRGGFVRDAHMLYLETFGELGLIGGVLLVALFALILGAGAIRAVRAVDPARQAVLAAATAACATFMAAATLEWAWEMTVLAVAMLLLAAVVLGPDRDRWRADPDPDREAPDAPGAEGARGRGRRLAPRAALSALAVAGLIVVAVPLAATGAVRDSRAAAADGRLGEALTEARTAAGVQPYAATPALQRALLLERAGRLEPAAAAAAATEAARAEPTNWRTWLIRARILAAAGETTEAVSSYARARSLNPQSTLWNQLEGAAAARRQP